jgi:hypothetical protein
MIELSDCLKFNCINSLKKKHKDHVKEAKKKDKQHICGTGCQIIEYKNHVALHELYKTLEK